MSDTGLAQRLEVRGEILAVERVRLGGGLHDACAVGGVAVYALLLLVLGLGAYRVFGVGAWAAFGASVLAFAIALVAPKPTAT